MARETKAGNREANKPVVDAVRRVSKGGTATDEEMASKGKRGAPTKALATRDSRDMKNAGAAGQQTMRMARGTARRAAFEASAEGQKRGQQIVPLGSESKSDAYMRLGYHEHDVSPHPMGQRELPGMGSLEEARSHGLMDPKGNPLHQGRTIPDLAPAPPHWEDMAPHEQAETQRRAAEHGVTHESAKNMFGAQLDQAHERASGHGMTPYAGHFYAGDDPSRPDGTENNRQPREVLKTSAARNGVPFASQVVANGITSPRQKFQSTDRETGETSYPNDDMANHAIGAVNRGVEPEPHVVSGIHGNTVRAAHAVRQQQGGAMTAELRNPGGSSPFGSKTGPYTNNWLDPHGSHMNQVQFVSDVHSGGGGLVPHVDSEAPYKRDSEGKVALNSEGNPTKDPSQRERYLDIPGIKSFNDHAVRSAMKERGLQSVTGAQATQWGEEQVQRGLASEAQAYPKQGPSEGVTNSHQFSTPVKGVDHKGRSTGHSHSHEEQGGLF